MSDQSAASSRRRIHSVSDLIGGLNALLEDRVGRIWVMGEISGLSRPSSGHIYFTLGDERTRIRAAFFRGAAARVPFELKDGLEVVVYADVSIYDQRGELQLVVRKLEPRGQGSLQLAFEQLKEKLTAEGLFDVERKREVPTFPARVGVVTSATSAAVRDVFKVSGQRFPSMRLLLSPTRVQGEGAEHEIAAALDSVSRQPEVDVVLLVRGGGSLEDLWCFNTEVMVRAVSRCPVPVITGVGHETDLTLVDLAADVRAPTPSAAAARVLPDRDHLSHLVTQSSRRLLAGIRQQMRDRHEQWSRERDVLYRLAPSVRLAAQRRRTEAAQRALIQAGLHQSRLRRAELTRHVGLLDSLSPLAVLARGYALVQRDEGDQIVRKETDVSPGERISIRLSEGQIRAVVEESD
ncbi:MAG: exodeoxyribonuclease VII large subunit [Deltaproteobacteria bacterium]|nr:exodeoxyribonuclease VII large subunit [Deltaproteobacteria bacterium]